MKNNLIKEKSFGFSLLVIDFYKLLTNEKKEFIISKQVLRSATSIGANLEEGIGGYSVKDFYYKFNLSFKEALETRYWLNLLVHYFPEKKNIIDKLLEEVNSIIKILFSILKHNKKH